MPTHSNYGVRRLDAAFLGRGLTRLLICAVCLLLAGCIDIDIYPYPEEDDMAPSFPCIAADNLASSATLTASSEETGYPKENAVDPRPAERWQPTGSAPAYLQFEFANTAEFAETWAALTAWELTVGPVGDEGWITATANRCEYDGSTETLASGSATTIDPVAVGDAFELATDYEVEQWSTTPQEPPCSLIFQIRLPSDKYVYISIDDGGVGGNAIFSLYHEATLVDSYSTSGLVADIRLRRDSAGVFTASVYDADAWHELTWNSQSGGADADYLADELVFIQVAFNNGDATSGGLIGSFGPVTLNNGYIDEIDFIAVSGHNLATRSASWQLLGSADGTNWETIIGTTTPTNDRTFGQTIDTIVDPYRFYRFNLTAFSAPPSIGVVFLGPYCQFPARVEGNLDPDHRAFTRESNRSASVGAFLGSAITGIDRKISLAIGPMSLAWAAANLPGLFDLLTLYPAFVAWNLEDAPEAVYYLEIDQNELTAPMGPNSRRCTLNFRGPWEAETDGVVV